MTHQLQDPPSKETLSPLLLLVKTLCDPDIPARLREHMLETFDFSMGDTSLWLDEKGNPSPYSMVKHRVFISTLFDHATEENLLAWLTPARLTRPTKGEGVGHLYAHADSLHKNTVLDPDVWISSVICAFKKGYASLFHHLLAFDVPNKDTRLQEAMRFTDRPRPNLPIPSYVEALLESEAEEHTWRPMVKSLVEKLGHAHCAQYMKGGPSHSKMCHHVMQRFWLSSVSLLAFLGRNDMLHDRHCKRAAWLATFLVPETHQKQESITTLSSVGPMVWPVLDVCVRQWYTAPAPPLTLEGSIMCLNALLPSLWGITTKPFPTEGLDARTYKAGYTVLSTGLEAFPLHTRTLPFTALADSWFPVYQRIAHFSSLLGTGEQTMPTFAHSIQDLTRLPGWHEAPCHPMEAFSWLYALQRLQKTHPEEAAALTDCVTARWQRLIPPPVVDKKNEGVPTLESKVRESWLSAFTTSVINRQQVDLWGTQDSLVKRFLTLEPEESEELYQRWCRTFDASMNTWLKKGFAIRCRQSEDQEDDLVRRRIEKMLLAEELVSVPPPPERQRLRV